MLIINIFIEGICNQKRDVISTCFNCVLLGADLPILIIHVMLYRASCSSYFWHVVFQARVFGHDQTLIYLCELVQPLHAICSCAHFAAQTALS